MNPHPGFEFVLISADEFVIGSDPSVDPFAQTEEFPQHRLYVADFYMMRYPVTNAQYKLFVDMTAHRPPYFWPGGAFPAELADHPVVGVSFYDCVDFCLWSAQTTGLPLRLPTETEWEKAARGTDARLFPWGNAWDRARCNYAHGGRPAVSTAVYQFSPLGDSVYGVADMVGNVHEWCASLFGPYPYDPADGREQLMAALESLKPPSGPAAADRLVIRGGSRRLGKQNSRCACRSWATPSHRSDDTGFRLCYETR